MAETQTYNYIIPMNCKGCTNAVTRILEKLSRESDGALESFDVSSDKPHVVVVAKPELKEPEIHKRLIGFKNDAHRADKDWNKIPGGDKPQEEE